MSEVVIETIERDGYTGKIIVDEFPSNPREDDYNLAKLTQFSNRFTQPDEDHDPRVLRAWEDARSYHDSEVVERYARAFLDAAAVQWRDDPRSESRVFGYITNETVKREGIPDAQAALNGELTRYAAWAEGDVYGYVVEDENGVEVESCWGYYGEDELEYVTSEINRIIDQLMADRHQERQAMFRRLLTK